MPLFGRRQAGGAAPQPATPAPQPATPAPQSGAAAPAPSTGRIGTRYVMKQRLFALGEDFDITDERGQRAFHVNGKALRVRDTLLFEDAHGQEIYKIQEKVARLRDTMSIYRGNQVAASIHKALITPVRERFDVNIAGQGDLSVQGNILDHEYRIEQARRPVAEVSMRWFRVRDTYGVEIAPGVDPLLILAVTVGIDMLAHD
jgi:uncharacterized protein YxjI